MQLSIIGLKQFFIRLLSNKLFEAFVIGVIIFSALLIGVKTYEIDARLQTLLTILDLAVTVIFLLEIVVRMIAEERFTDFFKKGWNIFDFVIVTTSLIPIDDTEMVLLARLLRIFRVLRLISVIPELRILLNALIISIPRMGYVALLMFIIFYIYAAFGSFLFAAINPVLWGNIAISLLTLFRVATFEDWTDVMYETLEVYPFSWIFYISFIFLTAFVFLNMMIGVVLEVMQTEQDKYNRDNNEGAAGEVNWMKDHIVSMEEQLQRIEIALTNLPAKPDRPNKD